MTRIVQLIGKQKVNYVFISPCTHKNSFNQLAIQHTNELIKMKSAAVLLAVCGSAAAFAPSTSSMKSSALKAFVAEDMAGSLAPMGFFDPLGIAERADDSELKRYREAEVTHGRVAMLAVVGFLVGEKVEGSSFLFDSQITGPAINHLAQIPGPFWAVLTAFIGASELLRAKIGWMEPDKELFTLRDGYTPGDIGFDPLGLKPSGAADLKEIQTKELQNGRLAMLAVAGFVAQELVDGKGIIQHFGL
jgi:hypothetical protein